MLFMEGRLFNTTAKLGTYFPFHSGLWLDFIMSWRGPKSGGGRRMQSDEHFPKKQLYALSQSALHDN